MIDFSKDAQLSKQLSDKQNNDDKTFKQTSERHSRVDYDFADRTDVAQASKANKNASVPNEVNHDITVRNKEKRKSNDKFDKKLLTNLRTNSKSDTEFMK